MSEEEMMLRAKELIEEAVARKQKKMGKVIPDYQVAREIKIASGTLSLYKRGFFLNAQVQQFLMFLRYLEIDPSSFFDEVGL